MPTPDIKKVVSYAHFFHAFLGTSAFFSASFVYSSCQPVKTGTPE